jgi:hypothetical protein
MDIGFEELDYRRTALGELVLRRRTEPRLGVEVLEVKLGDEFLMSSLFTVSEVALANLALARLGQGPLDVVVGGLGLGYAARAVLDHESVRSLVVIEALEPVIQWHRDGMVPLGPRLCADARLSRLAAHLVPGGVFGLWSNDQPDAAVEREMRGAFARVETQVARFHNPLQDREAPCALYFGFTGA